MGFPTGEGGFLPETEEDKKLFLASDIAHQARKAIKLELGYNASAGISLNKTVAKISCGDNKPNGMTVVPRRYFKKALEKVPIKSIRMLGGKLGKQLREAGLETMGDIQPLDLDDLIPLVGGQA
jgi:nucleotidyltransferase/DNA polymerase involved in DNA repair